MTYPTARKWVAALNASNRGAGYLGRKNWTLPATPTTDETCSVAQGPHGNSFGFNCANSAMGSLYYRGLGLRQPNTAVPIPRQHRRAIQEFPAVSLLVVDGQGARISAQMRRRERQPRVFVQYRMAGRKRLRSRHVRAADDRRTAAAARRPRRARSCSRAPMGRPSTIPIANVTWLANANLAAEMRFNVAGIVADGAMARTTADDFIEAMNGYNRKGYLGQIALAAAADESRSELQHEGGRLQLQRQPDGRALLQPPAQDARRAARVSPWSRRPTSRSVRSTTCSRTSTGRARAMRARQRAAATRRARLRVEFLLRQRVSGNGRHWQHALRDGLRAGPLVAELKLELLVGGTFRRHTTALS